MLRLLTLALTLSSVLASPALATPVQASSSGHQADLRFGPLVGGQDIRMDLRTTFPNRPFALFYGLDGTPTVVGPVFPPIGLNLFSPYSLFFGFTDGAGRFSASLPTAPGSIAPPNLGLALFLHAFVIDTLGAKVPSNVQATEIEPLPATPGYLVEDGANRLPSGYDQLGAVHVQAADYNRDGFPDLALATDIDLRLWMNDGTGVFSDETATRISYPGDSIAALLAADVDRDGDIDLLSGGGYDDFVSVPNRLWLNDGTGVFTQDPSFPAGEGLATQFELADIDNDEDLDLFVANGSEGHLPTPGGGLTLFLGLGNGAFFEDTGFTALPWNDPAFDTTAVRAGDLDGDGDMDVMVGRSDSAAVDGTSGQPNVLLLGLGNGSFLDASISNVLPLRSDNTQDLALADIDGDLDLDILAANSVFGSVTSALSNDVLINQGGLQGGAEGVFADNTSSFLEPSNAANGIRLAIHADDLDADGDLDVLVTVHDLFLGADQMLFLNQGGGQQGVEGVFVRELWFDPPFSGSGGLGDFICWAAATFDADHDGDREIVLCGAGVAVSDPLHQFTTRLLINTKL
ncbi:MAG: FG-GAP repeat domain-containing protein [Planctomycetota bacterium]